MFSHNKQDYQIVLDSVGLPRTGTQIIFYTKKYKTESCATELKWCPPSPLHFLNEHWQYNHYTTASSNNSNRPHWLGLSRPSDETPVHCHFLTQQFCAIQVVHGALGLLKGFVLDQCIALKRTWSLRCQSLPLNNAKPSKNERETIKTKQNKTENMVIVMPRFHTPSVHSPEKIMVTVMARFHIQSMHSLEKIIVTEMWRFATVSVQCLKKEKDHGHCDAKVSYSITESRHSPEKIMVTEMSRFANVVVVVVQGLEKRKNESRSWSLWC